MVNTDVDFAEARRRLDEIFPTRESHLLWQLLFFALHGQAFDITFLDREPTLEASVADGFAREFVCAASDGCGLDQVWRLCRRIDLSNSTAFDLDDVWTLNYMPRDLDISGVDLSGSECRIGDNGETMREMISAFLPLPVASRGRLFSGSLYCVVRVTISYRGCGAPPAGLGVSPLAGYGSFRLRYLEAECQSRWRSRAVGW